MTTATNDTAKSTAPETEAPAAAYTAPAIYAIGRSNELLKGSGRHKNDDTGSRGFTVDQR